MGYEIMVLSLPLMKVNMRPHKIIVAEVTFTMAAGYKCVIFAVFIHTNLIVNLEANFYNIFKLGICFLHEIPTFGPISALHHGRVHYLTNKESYPDDKFRFDSNFGH